jgi:hypothetical protein
MTNQEKIFLNIISELKKRYENQTEYDILKASGLIRQLLVDSNPIIEQVNRKYKLKITYRVQERIKLPFERFNEDGTAWKPLYGIVFITPQENSPVELLNRDDFFKYELLSYHNEMINVLEVIKICANKYGGIHYDEKRNLKESSIDVTHKAFSFNNSSSVIRSMYSITGICLEALNPLAEKVKRSYP